MIERVGLFVFSGTGNSLWVAKELAKDLPNCEILQIPSADPKRSLDFTHIGIVTPVHMWGPPLLVSQFVRKIPDKREQYQFAVAVNAGQVANTLVILNTDIQSTGGQFSAGFALQMPSNYIMWHGAIPKSEQEALFDKCKARLPAIVQCVRQRVVRPLERGPLWQRVLLSGVGHRISTPHVAKMAKSFTVNNDCIHCGICTKICPTQNIEDDGKTLHWGKNCTQCLACLQWCPATAIEFDDKTAGKKRYHHPEISPTELMQRA